MTRFEKVAKDGIIEIKTLTEKHPDVTDEEALVAIMNLCNAMLDFFKAKKKGGKKKYFKIEFHPSLPPVEYIIEARNVDEAFEKFLEEVSRRMFVVEKTF